MKNGPSGRPNWAQSRLIRITQGGPKGAQASVIGFVLISPIIAGFLIGSWLDGRMHTQFWTPLLGLLGVVSGFREMLLVLKRLAPKPGDKTPPPGRIPHAGRTPNLTAHSPASAENDEPLTKQPLPRGATKTDDSVEEMPRQRLFSVPPPPFMDQGDNAERTTPTSEEVRERLRENDEPKT